MEPYEQLKTLPDSEKAKYFEAFIESIKLATDHSDGARNRNRRLSLENIFSYFPNNITNVKRDSSDGSPRKKQKTLDSWIIKSPCKNKTGTSSTLEKSTDLASNSDANDVSVNLDTNQRIHNLNGANTDSPSTSGIREKSPHKSDKVCNNLENTIENPQTENNKSAETMTVKRSVRLKAKYSEHSQLTERNTTKSSISSGSVRLNKSSKSTALHKTDNCDVSYDASKNIVSDHDSNVNNTNDHQTSNMNSVNKVTRNLRSRSVSLNLPSKTRSDPKLYNHETEKRLNISEKTVLSKNINAINPSSLSNCEAFYILEKECARINLNLSDLLQDKAIQNALHNPSNIDNDALLLINSFKSNNKQLPVVHLVDSRKKLNELVRIKERHHHF